MKIIERANGRELLGNYVPYCMKQGMSYEEAYLSYRQRVIGLCYTPIYGAWLSISHTMKNTLEKHKNAKLVEYKWTDYDKEMAKRNPAYAENLPRLWCPKLDREIGSDAFERRMRDEFWERFNNNDTELMNTINKCDKYYRVEI